MYVSMQQGFVGFSNAPQPKSATQTTAMVNRPAVGAVQKVEQMQLA